MKKVYMLNLSFVLLFFAITTGIHAQQITGNLKSWEKSDFLGFDEIGDCLAKTGDISSVYARTHKNTLIMRVTFDNMVTRMHNEVVSDNFADKNIALKIKLTDQNSRSIIFETDANLAKLSQQKRNFTLLRTPEANLWEAEINLGRKFDRQDLEFSISVVLDGKVVDFFLSDGRNSDAEGNCAFVHHGNQGITYTEVFYGSPGGQSGMDGSGFDEVLQVHEATGVPGNFHMSGTLMPAAAWHNPEFNTWLKTLAGNGIIEMMTSALGQHIMPFLHNNMNDWSVDIECDMVNFQYNYQPRTAWVPERVWLSPDGYPNSGVIDWIGDNWTQHGVWGVVLDDSPHLNGYDNRKIHWMNNGSGIDLRIIPINNSFVGNMHYNANGAKNQIAGMGSYNICVYGTDWEVAAEMNEHDGTYFLDNYESVLWWCHDNYPGVNVWKTVDAMQNPNFNGTGADLTNGTYGLLGGPDGYGGSDNSWYTQWAGTASHSDFHDPKWTYGYIWDDVRNNLMTAPNNNLAQLGWYILMINLHETGWFDGGSIAGWEHRYSAHIKNANVYAEAARWADGQYADPLACYFSDIDHDGVDEVVIHNQKIFAVFESIGGKVNWMFYKDDYGNAYSVVGSDMAYWAETDGDYNDGSNNHVAALSDVYPYQQDAVYDINLIQSFGDMVVVEFSQWGVKKRIELSTDANYLDVQYDFFGGDGYVKSGFTPGLMDILWSGKDHLQRMWGDYGSYCGQRNSSSGATVALVLGAGGASHNTQFEGTLVLGDEIKGTDRFFTRLYAGYTSEPTGTTVSELNDLAAQNMDIYPPQLNEVAFQIDNNTLELFFDEAVEINSAQNIANYSLNNFSNSYTIVSALRQDDWRKVQISIAEEWIPGDEGQIVVSNVEDLNGNVISGNNIANFVAPSGLTPHTIFIDGTNDFDPNTELMIADGYSLYLTWDASNLYIGFESLDLNGGGDLFVNIDTDQLPGSGATSGSWGRAAFANPYLPEYQVAIEGGGGSIQLNYFANGNWNYPGNNGCNSYEGWSGNGLTEVSIPWTSLGNPEGVALSVHVSEEDSWMIPAIFPTQNSPGNNAIITHIYAFYPPYIPGNMPFAGMEPNDAFVLPNSSPEITEWSPVALWQTMATGQAMNFSLTASDPDNDDLIYVWMFDGNEVGQTQNFELNALPGSAGMHSLIGKVSDGVPGNDADSIVWQIEITEDEVLSAQFTADITTVCLNGQVQFSDLSTGEVAQWLWTFEGGTPASSTAQNPLVSYQTSGNYDVTLWVTDNIENDSKVKAGFITVNREPVVNAGADMETCNNDKVILSGDAQNYSAFLWSTSGDGLFSNSSSLTSEYTPGAEDILNGYAEISLTAYPLSPCPAFVSDAMILTINTSPIITSEPQNVIAQTGTQAIFQIEAEGSAPISYTWFGPAGEIAGANTIQLTLEAVSAEDEGAYYCTVENSCDSIESTHATLTLESLITQTISIPNGWSGISSWLVPQNPMVETIFADMVANGGLVVLQNYEHVYWPGQNINSIDLNGGWDMQSGYQIKLNGSREITFEGNTPESKTLSYAQAGWQLMPVLSECPTNVEDLFAGMTDDVLVIKEVAGIKLYWPGVFQNLYQLEPGKSYNAGFSTAVSFTYPECGDLKAATGNADTENPIEIKAMNPNPVSHLLAFSPLATAGLLPGDVISIQTTSGTILAKINITQPGNAIGLPIFGDDPGTAQKDGFEAGDALLVKITRGNSILNPGLTLNDNYDDLDLRKNGLTQIKALDLNLNNFQASSTNTISFYPNPSTNILYLSGIDHINTLRIYSAQGNLILESEDNISGINIWHLAPGLYYVYIYQNNLPIIKKFVKQ